MTSNWRSLASTETASKQKTNIENGLASAEARARLAQYRPNKLPGLSWLSRN